MLEDLDQLSIRLAALIAYTQELASEAETLRASLSQVQSERDALQAKLAQEGTQAKVLTRKVDAYASEQAALQFNAAGATAVTRTRGFDPARSHRAGA